MSRHWMLFDASGVQMRAFYRLPAQDPNRLAMVPSMVQRMAMRVINEWSATQFLFCVDSVHIPCFRYALARRAGIAYKEGRPKEGIRPSDVTKYLLPIYRDLGIPFIYRHGFEGDDVIAGVVQRLLELEPDCTITVVARDKDILQVVNDKQVRLLWPEFGPRASEELADPEWVFRRLGVYPRQIADWKALAGDKSDGLPRVGGYKGKKFYGFTDQRAAELLRRFDTLDGVYENKGDLAVQERVWLESCRDQAYAVRDLAKLHQECMNGQSLPSPRECVPAILGSAMDRAFSAMSTV